MIVQFPVRAMTIDTKILRQRIIFRRVIQLLIILGIFLMALNRINMENDLFWQLKLGQTIWKTHSFPITDPYSLPAAGEVWTVHEWIPSLIFYLIFTYIGSWGLVLLKAFILALTFTLFLLLFNKLKVNLYLSLLVLVMAVMVNTRGLWAVFPSIFEYLFLALTIFLVEYFPSTSKIVPWLLIILSLVWANSHGSFFILPVILFCYSAGSFLTPWLKRHWRNYEPAGKILNSKEQFIYFLVGFTSLLISFVNPNGVWNFLYPFRISFGKFTSYVSEYQKLLQAWTWNWSDFIGSLTIVLIFFIVLFFILSIKKLRLIDVFLATAFICLTFSAVRHTAVFSLVALFLIVKYISVWFGEYRGIFARSLIKDLLVTFIIISLIYFYKTHYSRLGFDFSEDGYPKMEAEIINGAEIPGNMFNHYNYGGYLIWKMPNYKVFIDGRLEMYEGQAGDDYISILEAKPEYKDLMNKYDINFFISYWRDPIINKLLNDPEWVYIYNDDQYVLMVKNVPANEKLINEYKDKDKEAKFREDYLEKIKSIRVDYYNTEALKYIRKRDYISALFNLQSALDTDPQNITVNLNMAQVYFQMSSYNEAFQHYQDVLAVDPENQIAKKGLQEVEKVKNNPKKINIY